MSIAVTVFIPNALIITGGLIISLIIIFLAILGAVTLYYFSKKDFWY